MHTIELDDGYGHLIEITGYLSKKEAGNIMFVVEIDHPLADAIIETTNYRYWEKSRAIDKEFTKPQYDLDLKTDIWVAVREIFIRLNDDVISGEFTEAGNYGEADYEIWLSSNAGNIYYYAIIEVPELHMQGYGHFPKQIINSLENDHIYDNMMEYGYTENEIQELLDFIVDKALKLEIE